MICKHCGREIRWDGNAYVGKSIPSDDCTVPKEDTDGRGWANRKPSGYPHQPREEVRA